MGRYEPRSCSEYSTTRPITGSRGASVIHTVEKYERGIIMSKSIITITIVASLLMGINANAESVNELVKQYQETGASIVDMVNSQSVSVDEIEKKVVDLTRISVDLTNRYKQIHPDGAKLLDITIEQVAALDNGSVVGVGPMADLTFDEIEGQWHDLGYFESNDVGVDLEDEDNEHFTDPMHVMIHPIMVLRAAKDYATSSSPDDLNAMKAEMEEGMEQVALVGEVLE